MMSFSFNSSLIIHNSSLKMTDQDKVAALGRTLGVNLDELYKYFDDDEAEPRTKYNQQGQLIHLNLNELNLTILPDSVGEFEHLQELYLAGNQLTELPDCLRQLSALRILTLGDYAQHDNNSIVLGNLLHQLSPWIIQLTRLEILYLSNNKLTTLPPEIGQLGQLQQLIIANNPVTTLPAEIGQLTQLQELIIINHQLTILPPEIEYLIKLRNLWLFNKKPKKEVQGFWFGDGKLRHLPKELGNLTQLTDLLLEGNPLKTPPPEIVEQGTESVLEFLRALQVGSKMRFESKLLLVGNGRAGKTSLLEALLGHPFDPQRDSTHGIEIKELQLGIRNEELGIEEPNQTPNSSFLIPNSPLQLHAWDFGGQQIYHTTHQFFLSERSLYLVVWNGGADTKEAGIERWLENIKVLAPDSPIILVATHADQRQPDVNFQALQARHPKLLGSFAVSNQTGAGLAELTAALQRHAAALPLMEQEWPSSWLQAEAALLAQPAPYIDVNDYDAICTQAGVAAKMSRKPFGAYLHDLGKILYFQDDDLLSNWVVLQPNWITQAMSRVLDDPDTQHRRGILHHADLPRIWADYPRNLYPMFLRFMERFELSYQIKAEANEVKYSLVPLLLPYEPPLTLTPPLAQIGGAPYIRLVYQLSFMPPGLMSWFITLTHRYSQNLHWREGCLLSYREHHARVELFHEPRQIELWVWGVQPHNFFTLLMETWEQILRRFSGLTIERRVPCSCQGEATPCPRHYLYDDLVRRMAKQRLMIECPDSFAEVAVMKLLYGIHASTKPQIEADLATMKAEILQGQQVILQTQHASAAKFELYLKRIQQLTEWNLQQFTRLWNLKAKELEVACPNTFMLTPTDRSLYSPKNWLSQPYNLYLFCQNPVCPHIIQGAGYEIRSIDSWFATVRPWLRYVLEFGKYALPIGNLSGVPEELAQQMEESFSILEALDGHLLSTEADSMPEAAWRRGMSPDETLRGGYAGEYAVEGAALRAWRKLLTELDPTETWAGLRLTPTQDGNLLWLCAEHRALYIAKPLDLSTIP